MARSFQNSAFGAKSVFGTIRESSSSSSTSSSHIEDVKSRTLFRSAYAINCNNVACDLKNVACIKKKQDLRCCNRYNHSYNYLLDIRRGFRLDKDQINGPSSYYNQMDLISGLYNSIDLTNVTSVCAGADADTCITVTGIDNNNCPPLYQNYRIDPDGELFGNTPCTINNYLNYVVSEK
jgi:hypothetical protein